jgi:hypothetical protein
MDRQYRREESSGQGEGGGEEKGRIRGSRWWLRGAVSVGGGSGGTWRRERLVRNRLWGLDCEMGGGRQRSRDSGYLVGWFDLVGLGWTGSWAGWTSRLL